MNGDPYRTPQPADRRVINRSGQQPAAYQQRADEQPQQVADEVPRVTPRSHRSAEPDKGSKKGLWWVLGFIGLVLILVVTWFIWSSGKNQDGGIDSSKYQAVFLTNGQIYFGNLHAYNDEYLRLTTGYYPQAKTTETGEIDDKTKQTTSNSNGIQLIRLGDEVYGPENEIFISKKQILHYENLKPDSKVSQLIRQNEQSK